MAMMGVDEYGSRRHLRTIILAGAILLVIWVFSTSRLFDNSEVSISFSVHVFPMPPQFCSKTLLRIRIKTNHPSSNHSTTLASA